MLSSIKTYSFFILLFFGAFGISFAQAGKVPQNRMDSLAQVVLNQKIPKELIFVRLNEMPAFNRKNMSNNEIKQFHDLLIKRFGANPSIDDELQVVFVLVNLYKPNQQIGKCLVLLDQFTKKVKAAGNKRVLARLYDMYSGVYEFAGMPEKRIEFAGKSYRLFQALEKDAEKRKLLSGGYAWSLTQVGWQLKKNNYLDSAVVLLRLLVSSDEYKKAGLGGIIESYSVLTLTLARLKRYEEVLASTKQILTILENASAEERAHPNTIHHMAVFKSRMGLVFAQLNQPDSAFHYLYLPLHFYATNRGSDLYYSKTNTYYDANHFFNLIEAHKLAGQYREAAQLCDDVLFSKHKTTDSSLLAYVYLDAAAIYEKAGRKDEAIFCYREGKILVDEMNEEEKKVWEETAYTSTLLQIQATEEAAAVQQEKIEATVQQERKQKTIILISAIAGATFLILFLAFMYNRYRVTRRQKLIIENQKKLVESKNLEITQSIEYALRIQTAILPPQRVIKQYIQNSFVFYRPKDIVAGDFYWMETVGDYVLFAACDCTGHGVPGAMVSVVCHNALNRAVREFGLLQPAAILDKTAQLVVEDFSKSEENIKDGMDVSLCAYNTKTKTLEWAGANNPLWLVRNAQLEETKADKQPIGMSESRKPFTNHIFQLQGVETIYLFTDGFADQFGGEGRQKKLTKARFKELLLSMQNIPLDVQGKKLDEFILAYRKDIEQLDDILVIGVQLN